MFTTREKRAIGRAWGKMNWLSSCSKESITRYLKDEQLRGGNDLTVLTDKIYNLITSISREYRGFIFEAIRDGVELDSVVYFKDLQSLKEVKQELKNLKIKIKDCYFGRSYSNYVIVIGFKNNDDLITFRLGQSIVIVDKIINVTSIWE